MSLRNALWLGALVLGLSLAGCSNEPADPLEKTLELSFSWMHGIYDTSAQVARDEMNQVPANEAHRLMHQLYAPVDVPRLQGKLVFQQSSLDGSEDPELISRHGLVQVFVDRDAGAVRYRELSFTDGEKYKNAHRNPDILTQMGPDDFTWNEGCDFYINQTAEDRIEGPMPEGTCRIQMGQELIADDYIVITPTEFWFKGKYVNKEGKVMWGTESEEMNKLIRTAEVQ